MDIVFLPRYYKEQIKDEVAYYKYLSEHDLNEVYALTKCFKSLASNMRLTSITEDVARLINMLEGDGSITYKEDGVYINDNKVFDVSFVTSGMTDVCLVYCDKGTSLFLTTTNQTIVDSFFNWLFDKLVAYKGEQEVYSTGLFIYYITRVVGKRY